MYDVIIATLISNQSSLMEEALLIKDIYQDTGCPSAQHQLMSINHEIQHIENQLYALEVEALLEVQSSICTF